MSFWRRRRRQNTIVKNIKLNWVAQPPSQKWSFSNAKHGQLLFVETTPKVWAPRIHVILGLHGNPYYIGGLTKASIYIYINSKHIFNNLVVSWIHNHLQGGVWKWYIQSLPPLVHSTSIFSLYTSHSKWLLYNGPNYSSSLFLFTPSPLWVASPGIGITSCTSLV
jgi:hypothetical protein